MFLYNFLGTDQIFGSFLSYINVRQWCRALKVKNMKKIIDWFKLALMVVMGLVWIVIADYGCFHQVLGMMLFLAAAFVWATSEQAAKVIKFLID